MSRRNVKSLQRGSLSRCAFIACLFCTSIACLLGIGEPPPISAPLACPDNTWTATATASVPEGRYAHTAIWTGSEMIIWGGGNGSSSLNTGARYNPATDSWIATSTTNAPSTRGFHSAVWTGREMIIWGGGNATNDLNTGGRYNPNTDTWISTSTANAPL